MEKVQAYAGKLWKEGSLLFAFLIYVLLLLRLGYEYGRADQMEVLPYAMWLNDPSLFSHDLFLQGLIQFFPNERLAIASLLSLFGPYLQAGTWLLHFLAAMGLILGLEQTARLLVKEKYAAWAAVFLCLIPFYYWNPGGNELYYNLLTAANIAKAIGIWGLYMALKDRPKSAALLISLATFFHPIAGLQLALLLFGVYSWQSLMDLIHHSLKPQEVLKQRKSQLWALAIYLSTGFLYILAIKMSYDAAPRPLPSEQFFDIIFDFRNGHHYMPGNYSLKGMLLMLFCWGIAIYYFRKNDFLFPFFILLMLGYLLYPLGTEILRSSFIAPFQWYKTTIWLKFLGMTAAMALLWSFLPQKGAWRHIRGEPYYLAGILALALMLLIIKPSVLPWKMHLDFGQQVTNDPVVAICRQAQLISPKDAVFIYPMEISELQSYGLRSGYVDYKANLKQNAGAAMWAKRTQQVYGLSPENRVSDIQGFAKEHFRKLSLRDLGQLKIQGVTHILTYADILYEDLTWLAGNEDWAIYSLDLNNNSSHNDTTAPLP